MTEAKAPVLLEVGKTYENYLGEEVKITDHYPPTDNCEEWFSGINLSGKGSFGFSPQGQALAIRGRNSWSLKIDDPSKKEEDIKTFLPKITGLVIRVGGRYKTKQGQLLTVVKEVTDGEKFDAGYRFLATGGGYYNDKGESDCFHHRIPNKRLTMHDFTHEQTPQLDYVDQVLQQMAWAICYRHCISSHPGDEDRALCQADNGWDMWLPEARASLHALIGVGSEPSRPMTLRGGFMTNQTKTSYEEPVARSVWWTMLQELKPAPSELFDGEKLLDHLASGRHKKDDCHG